MSVWICTATLNESENILALLADIRAALPIARVIIVDDNSPDGTGDMVEALISAGDDALHLIRRPGRLGYASAHREAMRYALDHGATVIMTMDADRSHDPKHLTEMLAEIEAGADLVLGSRYVEGGGTEGWPWNRRMLSALANKLARRGLRVSARDCTSGYRAYRRELLESIRFEVLQSEGYCFLEQMLLGADLAGGEIREVPIVFVERRAGKSKMSWKVIVEAAWVLGVMTWRTRFGRASLVREMVVEACADGRKPRRREDGEEQRG